VSRSASLIAALLALAVAPAAVAADCPRTTLGDVEDEVMCPVCGTPLALAEEAPQAVRQRAYIERLVEDCRSKDEVKRALVAQFGEAVLALPGDEGDDSLGDVLVYLVPALALLLGAVGIGLAALRWRRRRPSPATGGRRPPSSELDADMDRYDL
jgi:cytochrome c-type biogenesis protein CcmH/NrfF